MGNRSDDHGFNAISLPREQESPKMCSNFLFLVLVLWIVLNSSSGWCLLLHVPFILVISLLCLDILFWINSYINFIFEFQNIEFIFFILLRNSSERNLCEVIETKSTITCMYFSSSRSALLNFFFHSWPLFTIRIFFHGLRY